MRCGGEALARRLNARLATQVVSFERFSELGRQQKFAGSGKRSRPL
jgi:hypothetical protein